MSEQPPRSQREALDRRNKQVLERFVKNEKLQAAVRESLDSIRRGVKPKPYRELRDELTKKKKSESGDSV